MTDLGVARGKVELQKYQELWKLHFQKEKDKLQKLFQDRLPDIKIYHVGSTAIPGSIAKPIIDMLLVINEKIHQVKDVIEELLVKSEYHFRENGSNDDKLFYAKGSEDHRTHYLHITQKGSRTEEEMLKFRNSLRSDDRLRDEYENLKLRLKDKYKEDREKYTTAKHDFIQKVIQGGPK